MKNPQVFKHVLLLLLFSALIGLLYPLVKIAEQSIPPITFTMLRAFLAAVFLVLVVGLGMKRNLADLCLEWKTYAILGMLLSLFFVSISQAEEDIAASLSAVLGCLLPIATFLITTLILHWERFSFIRFSGTLLALFGVAVFIGLDQLLNEKSEILGISLIAGGYGIYAVYLVFARARQLDPYLAATGTMIFVTLFLTVVAFIMEQPLEIQPGRDAILATLFIGIFSTGLNYVVLYYLVANAGPVFTSTFGYFMPIFAILASHVLIGEPLGWTRVAGIAITVAGAWLVNRKPQPLPA